MGQSQGELDTPVARGARAATRLLVPDGSLTSEVEAALHRQDPARPERYVDPISVAALIVSVAQLAWTIYTDLKKKKKTPSPNSQVIARRVRIELTHSTPERPAERDRIIDVVVEETIREIEQ